MGDTLEVVKIPRKIVYHVLKGDKMQKEKKEKNLDFYQVIFYYLSKSTNAEISSEKENVHALK